MELEAELTKVLKPARVSVFDCGNLADVVEREPALLTHHYGQDIQELRDWLEPTEGMRESQILGLRVALTTQFGDLGESLRREVIDALLLAELVTRGDQTSAGAVNHVSATLRLAGSLPAQFADDSLRRLIATKDAIEVGTGVFQATENGKNKYRETIADSAKRLATEKSLCIAALKQQLGYDLSESQEKVIWKALTRATAEAFEAFGANLAETISAIATGEGGALSEEKQSAVDRIAARVGIEFSDAQQKDEISTAVAHLLLDQTSPLSLWAQRIAASFLMMCSLGISNEAKEHLSRAIRQMVIVPDTDVVISLLCGAEENCQAINSVFRSWRAIGGRVEVLRPVLEEVARHAWIAEEDYREVAHLLPKLRGLDTRVYVQNAFVRAYWAGNSSWSLGGFLSYINDYRGRSKYDFSRIAEILEQDYHFKVRRSAEVSETAWRDDSEGRELSRALERLSARFEGRQIDDLDDHLLDKIHRDVAVLLSVARTAERSASYSETFIILTSSYRLVRAGRKFSLAHQGFAVLRPASLAALVSLVPNVTMRSSTIAALVMEPGIFSRLTPVERTAIRTLASLGPLKVPAARIATFRRKLKDSILEFARQAGKPRKEVERLLGEQGNETARATIIATAVRRAAFGAQAGTVEDLIRENDRLRAENAMLRTREEVEQKPQ